MRGFSEFADLCRRLAGTAGRLDKRRLTAEYLRGLDADEVAPAVDFLTGRAFPATDPRALNVRGLPPAPPEAIGPPLTLTDVATAFADVAATSGAGARRSRDERLAALTARASPDERLILSRIISGEMRNGVSDGLVLEAIAEAAGADLAIVRRAALFLGDLSRVATLAREGGPEALARTEPRVFVPLLPMLAEIAGDFGEVLRAHRGRTALEFKYDGARIQLHREGDRVAIWTRRLSDVTASLPDVAATSAKALATWVSVSGGPPGSAGACGSQRTLSDRGSVAGNARPVRKSTAGATSSVSSARR